MAAPRSSTQRCRWRAWYRQLSHPSRASLPLLLAVAPSLPASGGPAACRLSDRGDHLDDRGTARNNYKPKERRDKRNREQGSLVFENKAHVACSCSVCPPWRSHCVHLYHTGRLKRVRHNLPHPRSIQQVPLPSCLRLHATNHQV